MTIIFSEKGTPSWPKSFDLKTPLSRGIFFILFLYDKQYVLV
jgi:hypothetical protein